MLGVPHAQWTLLPATAAALLAAPLLAALGTSVALCAGAVVGGPSGFGLISQEEFWEEAGKVVWEWPQHVHPLKYAPFVNACESSGLCHSGPAPLHIYLRTRTCSPHPCLDRWRQAPACVHPTPQPHTLARRC
eukprot:scaffold14023_cov124-Isochrysis_galbana.AAC.1